MSIDVEMIGTGLVAQHCVGELTEAAHCKMVSISSEKARPDRQQSSGDHDSRVTPLFAESIARAARRASA